MQCLWLATSGPLTFTTSCYLNFRQLMERHATAVPGLPRKPWVNEAVSKLLQAHAEARRSYRSALSSLRCARLRVSFLAWAVCPRSRPRALRPFPHRRCPTRFPWPVPRLTRIHPVVIEALLCRTQLWQVSAWQTKAAANIAYRLKPNASWLIKTGFRPVLMSSLQKLQRRTQHQCGTLLRD